MDYLEFYRLKEHPFSNVVDNRFYFNSHQLANALIKLKYAIDSQRGLAVVVGDIGTGKTTLARRLLEDLDEGSYEATLLVVIHSSVSSDWLLKKLAMLLGTENVADDKIKILSQIHNRLMEINESGRKAVILIDEVQMLNSRDVMEEFRGLLNIELANGKLVNFIFFGLSEIDKVLALDEPLKQRVALKLNIKSFSEADTLEYIQHRLKVASSYGGIFTNKSIKAIYKYSDGTPRLINTICDNALLEGFLMKKNPIDEEIIETVAKDLGLLLT
ncbi:archaeal ATPase [bacterium BMS3Abin07]|nr:archaeal ATPase [bacterium BMS3Abin07]GBE32522.1 archaeal ATPase [bacterium BMS3Bbin05]HDL19832.1 AAA family ATPase [Nitrospirota bacterium]HDO23425.1 AAA family ATPase [Nitrospirota bacterium]HDZ88073.1 AAA family ATPase [Nitrospirota bacterium]